ncbi:MAG: hypothetical protein HN411_02590 [Waddliaceae bacterium]|jgi:hypothetical protein|nr:hypothetical protein [Waddliaceae bacterium]MBT3578699.1 hypothetical protein [Waddliaceae bacterium]MBT4444399.1 hypothetical protein [Waddliaceae bacterium]MBT6928314.1 hypothetical protein [Waddliaceae bacterium]MBT7265000.1 hypothetical protein [Waddliaceae bacterium]
MNTKAFKEYLVKQTLFFEEQKMRYDHCFDDITLSQLFKQGEHIREGAYEARITSKGFARKVFWGKLLGLFGTERRYMAAWHRYRNAEKLAILRTAEKIETIIIAEADKIIAAMEENNKEEYDLDAVDKILKIMERNEFLTSAKMVKSNAGRIFHDIEGLSHAKKERDTINEHMKEKEEELLVQQEALRRRISIAYDEGLIPIANKKNSHRQSQR